MNYAMRVYGVPEAQGRPRFCRGRVFSPKSAWHATVCLQGQVGGPRPIMRGPIAFRVDFIFTRPKRIKLEERWKITKPDLDNLLKSTLDALTKAGWWGDDNQIARVTMHKRYANADEAPGAVIAADSLS